jgi:hypothetical protein
MSTYSTNLALELIANGDQSGTWGDTTNTNLGTLIEQAISGYVTYSCTGGTDTITIPNGTTGVARNMFLELTGTGGGTLVVPSNKKLYFIYNNTSTAITVKVSGQTGVSVPAGKKMILVSNGTDVIEAVNYLGASAPLAVSSGGTGLATLTANNLLLGNGTGNVQFVAPGSSGNVLTSNGTTWTSSAGSTFVSTVTATSPLSSTGGNTPAISIGSTIPVTLGGTGVASATAYALLAGGTTSTGAHQSLASVGTSGQLLTSNGAGALPTFQNAPSGGVTSIVAGSCISVSGSTTVTVSYQGSFNAVGSYTLATINNAGASSGSNYSAGTGTGQVKSVSFSLDLTQAPTSNNLSGTWQWMGSSTSIGDVCSVCYRVA